MKFTEINITTNVNFDRASNHFNFDVETMTENKLQKKTFSTFHFAIYFANDEILKLYKYSKMIRHRTEQPRGLGY